MSATELLRQDHLKIKRLEKIIEKCYQSLYEDKNIPISDIEKINFIIMEFLDSIHYSREEDSDRKSTRLNSSHPSRSRMPSSA